MTLTGIESQSHWIAALPILVLGWWEVLAQAAIPIISSLLGGQNNENEGPRPIEARFPSAEAAFMDWLTSSFYQKPGGGWDVMGNQAFQGIGGGPQGYGSSQGPGTDIIGQMSPDVNNTILPNVWSNWQPWDSGTQYIADAIYNKMPLGQDDPRTTQLMTQGGFGGPGHTGMQTALQYGVPSEGGRYMANLAQFGVTSTPMADFMKTAMQGGLNQYRKAPVPMRNA